MKTFNSNRSFKNRVTAVMVAFAASLCVAFPAKAQKFSETPDSAQTFTDVVKAVTGGVQSALDEKGMLNQLFQVIKNNVDAKLIAEEMEAIKRIDSALAKNPNALGKNVDVKAVLNQNMQRKAVLVGKFFKLNGVKTALKTEAAKIDKTKISVPPALKGTLDVAKAANTTFAVIQGSMVVANLLGDFDGEGRASAVYDVAAMGLGMAVPIVSVPDIVNIFLPESIQLPTLGGLKSQINDDVNQILTQVRYVRTDFANLVENNRDIDPDKRLRELTSIEELSESYFLNEIQPELRELASRRGSEIKQEFLDDLSKLSGKLTGGYAGKNYGLTRDEISRIKEEINGYDYYDVINKRLQAQHNEMREKFAKNQIDAMYKKMLQEMGISAEVADRLELRKEYDARVRKNHPLSYLVKDIEFGRLSMGEMEDIYGNLFKESYGCRNAGRNQCMTVTQAEYDTRNEKRDEIRELALEILDEYNYEDYGVERWMMEELHAGNQYAVNKKVNDLYRQMNAIYDKAVKGGDFDEKEYTRLLRQIYDDYMLTIAPKVAEKQGITPPDESTWTPKDPIEDVAVVVPEPGQEPEPKQPDPVKDVAVAPDPEPAQPEPPKNTEPPQNPTEPPKAPEPPKVPGNPNAAYMDGKVMGNNTYYQYSELTGYENLPSRNITVKNNGSVLEFSSKHRARDKDEWTFKLDSDKAVKVAGKNYYQGTLDMRISNYTRLMDTDFDVFRVNAERDFYTFNTFYGEVVGYAGIRLKSETGLPKEGMSTYTINERNNATTSAAEKEIKMTVNWQTGKVHAMSTGKIGPKDVFDSALMPAFFVGSVDRDSLKITGNWLNVVYQSMPNTNSSNGNSVNDLWFLRSGDNSASLDFYGIDYPRGVGGIFEIDYVTPGTTAGSKDVVYDTVLSGFVDADSVIRNYTPKNGEVWKGFAAGAVGNLAQNEVTLVHSTSPDAVRLELQPELGALTVNIGVQANNGKFYSFVSDASDANAYVHQGAFAVFKYQNNTPSYVVTTMDERDNYDYLSWGNWSVHAPIAFAEDSDFSSVYFRSHWIAGSMTPSENIPKTGTADYSGTVRGTVTNSENGLSQFVHGTSSLKADFGAGTMNGELVLNAAYHYNYFSGRSSVTTNLNAVSISGNQFSGGLAGDHIDTGSIHGAFYGPQAQEMGGNWAISGNTYEAVGIFAGKQ